MAVSSRQCPDGRENSPAFAGQLRRACLEQRQSWHFKKGRVTVMVWPLLDATRATTISVASNPTVNRPHHPYTAGKFGKCAERERPHVTPADFDDGIRAAKNFPVRQD